MEMKNDCYGKSITFRSHYGFCDNLYIDHFDILTIGDEYFLYIDSDSKSKIIGVDEL
jgi:hypothetical protein